MENLLSIKGADNRHIPHTTDAVAWARAFIETIKTNPSIPLCEGTMITWFANAIMAGVDSRAKLVQLQEAVDLAAEKLPEDCEIVIEVERGSGSVYVADEHGTKRALHTDRDTPIAAAIKQFIYGLTEPRHVDNRTVQKVLRPGYLYQATDTLLGQYKFTHHENEIWIELNEPFLVGRAIAAGLDILKTESQQPEGNQSFCFLRATDYLKLLPREQVGGIVELLEEYQPDWLLTEHLRNDQSGEH